MLLLGGETWVQLAPQIGLMLTVTPRTSPASLRPTKLMLCCQRPERAETDTTTTTL